MTTLMKMYKVVDIIDVFEWSIKNIDAGNGDK